MASCKNDIFVWALVSKWLSGSLATCLNGSDIFYLTNSHSTEIRLTLLYSYLCLLPLTTITNRQKRVKTCFVWHKKRIPNQINCRQTNSLSFSAEHKMSFIKSLMQNKYHFYTKFIRRITWKSTKNYKSQKIELFSHLFYEFTVIQYNP